MAQNITLLGANYPDVPAVTLPITGGGTATFSDTRSVTYNLTGGATASVTPSEVVTGQGFSVKLTAPTGYNLNNVTITMGGVDITSQVFNPDESGGSPSATQHSIYFEFTDSTNTTITGYWDDSFISNAITATTPTTYGNKTVSLAQLDGVTWYEPASIPLNTQLIDFASVQTGYTIDDNGNIISSDAWNCVTDYTAIDSTMTFSFKCNQYATIGFYDSGQNAIRTVEANSIKDSATNYIASGSLTPSIIPANARYVVMVGNSYSVSDTLSLIRTA